MFESLTGLEIVAVIASILAGMVVHETMHGLAAYWLGDSTAKDEGRLSLNPLKHIDPITTVALPVVLILLHLPPLLAAKPVPFTMRNLKFGEYGAALVAVAGPISNFLLAALGALVFHASGVLPGSTAGGVFQIFIVLNLALFVFNMIPLPPLDGSRLLYAFAPRSLQRIMEVIESYGLMLILVFVLVFLPVFGNQYSNIILSLYNFLV